MLRLLRRAFNRQCGGFVLLIHLLASSLNVVAHAIGYAARILVPAWRDLGAHGRQRARAAIMGGGRQSRDPLDERVSSLNGFL